MSLKKMKLFASNKLRNNLRGKYIFLDSDFLGELFNDEEIFRESIRVFSKSFLLLDPLIEFEFLRDVFVPELRVVREEFISKQVFSPVGRHQDIFIKLQDNALLLSKIYAHQQKVHGCSMVDLLLAGRLMLNEDRYRLVTGNKKDFPSCVFDVVGVLNMEVKESGTMRPFSVIVFNRKKFEECFQELQKLEDRYRKQLTKQLAEDSQVPF